MLYCTILTVPLQHRPVSVIHSFYFTEHRLKSKVKRKIHNIQTVPQDRKASGSLRTTVHTDAHNAEHKANELIVNCKSRLKSTVLRGLSQECAKNFYYSVSTSLSKYEKVLN